MSGLLLILIFITEEAIFAAEIGPAYPLLSQPVSVGQPRSWGRMLSDPELMVSRFDQENHLGEVSQEEHVTSNNVDVLELLQTLRQNISNLEVGKLEGSEMTAKLKKRKTDPLDDVFEEVYEDYEDDKQAEWTSVGNGRVKIWPLSFGKSKNMCYAKSNHLEILNSKAHQEKSSVLERGRLESSHL